ncbi:RNA polymerase sigma factor [Alteromonas stellipolaris]|uniref:RNA polymerase sigma factor n=1 Tax=Alteromonas stellipolaris TaxID=233316 RepID=UPI002734DCBA|nr:sigma-70 family RNA polymerase sigma factor [Alteromonas stellipolaris]MDP2535901.1 sigma-70 family RNA polymerase sigma factor [Alteromonas stellipolaris]
MTESESVIATALVKRILAGDAAAELQMIERYKRGLRYVLRRKCHDLDLTADISQETWRIVIERIRNNELREPAKLSAFILQTAKNLLLMHFRKSDIKRQQTGMGEALESEYSGPSTQSPEDALERHNLGLLVQTVIKELNTPRDRELLHRYYIHEQDKSLICNELNVNAKNFDNVLYRCKQRFKTLWLAVMEDN